ncbi:MAG: hypothetical protein IJV67_04410 [Clostridia bacterium]|nr:hypothetical protein [Clostridia bacterium]
MKRVICIILVAISLFAFSACGYKVQQKTYATDEQITAFFEGRDEFDDQSFKFKFTMTKTEKTRTSTVEDKITAKGFFNNKGEDAYELEYSGKVKTVTKEWTADGKEKTTLKMSEKGVFFDNGNGDSYGFFDVKIKEKGPNVKSNLKKKTVEEDQEILLYIQLVYVEIAFAFMGAEYGGDYTFIEGDKIRFVEEFANNFGDGSYYTEFVIVYDGNKLKSARYLIEYTNSKQEIVLTFGDQKEVELPKNKEEYK